MSFCYVLKLLYSEGTRANSAGKGPVVLTTMRREAMTTFFWLMAHLCAVAVQSAAQPCTNRTVRLVDGPVASAGRVEVCINGVWGRVCSGSWDSSAAQVVCRQLGYSVNTSEGISVNQASFDKGSGPVFLDYVKCYGTESSLLSCFHRVVYYSDAINDCSLSYDAGVVCPSSAQSCTNKTLRLVNGPLESAGRVEVCINGVWGTVCNVLLGDRFATVVCRQLGYSVNTGEAIAVQQGAFGRGTGPILLSNVDCTGTESSLLSCRHTEETNFYCSHLSDVGVVCPSSVQSCTDGTLRLADGPVENAGRVEICINGVWGTVCDSTDNGWNSNDARVVCRQLGYNVNTSGVIAINEAGYQASFGQGTGPVFLSNLGCTGNETSLLNCSHQEIGVYSCLNFDDVGVICPPVVQSCTNETLRLVDGPLESAGRVEICINGVWGTVCSNYPHSNYSRVVCRQLGYSVNTSDAIAVFYAFGRGTGPVFLNNIICTGTESSVLDCNYTWPDVHQCSHLADGGVVCPPSVRNCTDGTLRLVNGSLESAGTVEICINGIWGTVCADSWNNNNARVVCRQLGYSVNTGGAIGVLYSIAGQGTGPPLLRNVGCTGTESSLLSCSHKVAFCLNAFNAGVLCPSHTQSCTNGALRLVNGPLESAGTVEVCISGVWGTMCGGYWDNTETRVVCRQLGYNVNTGGVVTVFRGAFGEGTGPVLLHNVVCTGNESSLLNCSHQIGVTFCSHFYDVGVICPPAIQSCTNGTVRLVNGSLQSAGRVEICINGVWGTVCDEYGWDISAARVVCRQLGYSVDTGGAIAVFQAGFGQGTGPVFLTKVRCFGNESSLLSCSHQGIGVGSCYHADDAGVVCPPGPCQSNPCANGGTCSVQDTTNYTCSCAPGFTGANCSVDLNFCTPSTCLNGGTCIEGYGTVTQCICAEGFTGSRCDVDLPFCEVDTCLNGGTCIEGFGTMTACDCAAGFTGANCSSDLDFCTPSTCLNGGTCIEGFGTMTACDCAVGFTGANCSSDLDFCTPSTCLNGGTCIEGFGTMTACDCAPGFTGANCSSDLNFCTPSTCLNGGTCIEGFGTMTACDCVPGFTGANCSSDLDFCTPSTCLNGGTCIEGFGTMTACDCAPGFTGANCSSNLDFCTPSTCLNGGTCIEGFGTMTACDCAPGFTGANCSSNLDFCTPSTCLNGGTCIEGFGTMTACDCAPGFTGANCSSDLDFCTPSTCLNGGTCIEGFGTMTACDCAAGFTGANCSSDLDFCTPNTCLNGGTCIEGYGTETSCMCTKDFSGPDCTAYIPDECKAEPCQHIISKQPVDYSQCGFTNITFRLCQIQLLLRTSPEQAAENLANITSNMAEIHAVDVSVATSIVENLTTTAITNEEVRGSYLESIDNLIQVNADVIAQSQNERQSSSRLLDSLTSFTNNLKIPNTTTATFTRKTYALQVNDIDTSNFQGQTFSVDLGSVKEAMNISTNIREEAIDTVEGNKVLQNRTASVQVPVSVFQDLGQSGGQQRLSYAVFVRDTLFQSSDENQSNLTVGSIIVAVRVNGTTASGNLSTPITVTFQANKLAENATSIVCGRWDPQRNGELGAWTTANSCENASSPSSSSYLTRSTQPLQNSFGTTTMPTFIAQYTQPGHFAILLDLTGTPHPSVYGVVLQSFSYVGLVISLLCLTAFVMTHLVSRNLRKMKHEQILINLCLALMGMYLVFILGANAAPVPVLCGISAALLQYFMLVFFLWTSVEAFFLYQKVAKVLGVRQIPVLKIGLAVWLVPILIVGLSAGPGYKYYYQESKSGFCRSRDLPFYIGQIAPTAILYIFNLIMFVLIMVSICKQRMPGSVTEKSTLAFVHKNAIIAFTLAILFGLGWGFGLAASGTPFKEATFVLQLLFTIFVGCQGILIFVLHGIRKAEARDEWKKLFYTVTCRNRGVVKSSSTPSLSQHAKFQVESPSSSAYDLSSLPNETSSEIGFESTEKGEIPAKTESVEFDGANQQEASHKQSLIQAIAGIMKTPSESKQVRKQRTSLLTSITGKYRKYDLISHDSPESDSKGLLECEEEKNEEEEKGGVKEEEEGEKS